MCTSLAWNNGDFYFGRNLDLEYDFNQQVAITPRNYALSFKKEESLNNHYAMIGIASVMDNYPLYAEAINEKGLGMAGLNFPDYAYYNNDIISDKFNLAPYEIIPWILGKCENLLQARKLLEQVNIISIEFKQNLPLAPLHWIIADTTGSLVLESTVNGVKVFDNPIGVLTNNPTFDYQLVNLGNYINLTPNQVRNSFTKEMDLKIIGQGMGGFGLPGDYSPVSRFVKASFIKTNSICEIDEEKNVSQFFHMLDSVSMVSGSVITPENKCDITRYSCCCNGDKGIFYYKTYYNNQINAINMNNENLDNDKLTIYKLKDRQNINYIN